MSHHHYGYIPDLPDQRDVVYRPHWLALSMLPTSVDLRSLCPAVYDQGQLGSCTANAIAGALEFDQIKEQQTPYTPSRLFIYYNERAMEGTISTDSGATIRDGIKSVARLGDCPESEWPYDISQFAVQPPVQCYDDALMHKIISYQRVEQNVEHLKAVLASGYPVVFGFSVYESFESAEVAQSGIVPMPAQNETVLGGHAVLAVGYDDATQRFLVRNSWSTSWGVAGYCTMPYAYLASRGLASDFWTIRTVQ